MVLYLRTVRVALKVSSFQQVTVDLFAVQTSMNQTEYAYHAMPTVNLVYHTQFAMSVKLLQ
jgi:hypothetical protein